MTIRMMLAAVALAAPMMMAPTASYAGGLHHLSSMCPLNLLSHGRTRAEKPAKVEKKAAPKKVAAKAEKPAPKK